MIQTLFKKTDGNLEISVTFDEDHRSGSGKLVTVRNDGEVHIFEGPVETLAAWLGEMGVSQNAIRDAVWCHRTGKPKPGPDSP